MVAVGSAIEQPAPKCPRGQPAQCHFLHWRPAGDLIEGLSRTSVSRVFNVLLRIGGDCTETNVSGVSDVLNP